MSKWICRICATPCKLDFCTDKAEPELCAFLRAYDAQWEPDVPAAQPEPEPEPEPQPEPEPELMTGPEAVIAAMKQGGGEVWNLADKEVRVRVMADGKVEPVTQWSMSSCAKYYSVRPLAPALLPCPFCGGEATLNYSVRYRITCSQCNIPTACGETESETIAAWERREGSGT